MTSARLAAPPVPFTRLDNEDPLLLEELLTAVRDVASRAAFILGDEVEAFEHEFAAFCEAPHAVGVSSGTEALAIALRALEIGPGDEVVVPSTSFIATAEAVSLVGAIPRFADADPATGLVTRETIEAACTPRTRCLIPVHLYGRTVDFDPILAFARQAGLRVIEDAAQAHGARCRGRRVGTIADAGCFSFYPAKNLGGWGDGGAIVTADAGIAQRARLLRSHGEEPRYHHRIVGTTARLDALQAAVLRIKLRRLDDSNEARRQAARRLTDALPASVRPPVPADAEHDHVYHLYTVHHERRDDLRAALQRAGIASAVHYPFPIHRAPAYEDLTPGPPLPVSEWIAATTCSLPMFPSISAEEIERVAGAVARFGGDEERLIA